MMAAPSASENTPSQARADGRLGGGVPTAWVVARSDVLKGGSPVSRRLFDLTGNTPVRLEFPPVPPHLFVRDAREGKKSGGVVRHQKVRDRREIVVKDPRAISRPTMVAKSGKAVQGGDAADDLIGQLVAQAREKGLDLVGEGGLLQQLTKRVLESALEGEITDHLGYA
jgi:hypothetical protein